MHETSSASVQKVLQLAVEGEEPVLAAADHDQGPRAEAEDLPADLGADAAAGAGHHDDAAFDQIADGRVVELNWVASEQVVDIDAADGDLASAIEEVFGTGNDFEREPGFVAGIHQVPQTLAGEAAGNHQDVGDAAGDGNGRQIVERADDRNTAQA